MWACPFIWGLPARMDGNHCWAGPLRRRDLAGPLENSWKDPANLRLLREVRGNDQEIKCTTFVFFCIGRFYFFCRAVALVAERVLTIFWEQHVEFSDFVQCSFGLDLDLFFSW
jgi:hypothetical protein